MNMVCKNHWEWDTNKIKHGIPDEMVKLKHCKDISSMMKNKHTDDTD